MDSAIAEDRSGRHAVVLALLSALFVLRVAAQLVQAILPTPLLPPFESWQSGTLPYGVLLFAQVLIIVVLAVITAGLWRGRLAPRPALGRALLVIGGIYLAGATLRLIAGQTFMAGVPFMHVLLPSIFHMVLAGAVLTIGHFHSASGAR